MSENQIDLDLIDAFCNGDHEAFSGIVNRYSEKVFKLAYRMTRDEVESQDISQEVFTTVFSKVNLFQRKSAFSSWIYRVTTNAALMKLRKKRYAKVVSAERDMEEHYENFFVDPTTNESYLESFEIRRALQSAVDTLDTDYKTIFFLRDVDKMSNEEVADITGLTVAAVKSRLHRTRLYLREKLERFVNDIAGEDESQFKPLVMSGVKSVRVRNSMIT